MLNHRVLRSRSREHGLHNRSGVVLRMPKKAAGRKRETNFKLRRGASKRGYELRLPVASREAHREASTRLTGTICLQEHHTAPPWIGIAPSGRLRVGWSG
ncbi:unnamed protein product [Ectocarpus fasciculatus]